MTEKMERALVAANDLNEGGEALIVAFAQGLVAGTKIAAKNGSDNEEGAEADG